MMMMMVDVDDGDRSDTVHKLRVRKKEKGGTTSK
jgi:hypothetical protein